MEVKLNLSSLNHLQWKSFLEIDFAEQKIQWTPEVFALNNLDYQKLNFHS